MTNSHSALDEHAAGAPESVGDHASSSAAVDGRSARRRRNIDRTLDAVIELAGEGSLEPSWEEIADRAGVSHRSLYRYFEDRDALMRAALDRIAEQIGPRLNIDHLGEGPLESRIGTFVAARIDTYVGFGPIARTAFSATRGDVAREGIDASRSVLCGQLVEQFAPELDRLNHSVRASTIALLDVAFQFEALEYLAVHCALDHEQVGEILSTHLRTHLAPLAD